MRNYVGIDPGGSSGAIAVITIHKGEIVSHKCIYFSKSTLWEWFEFLLHSDPLWAMVENVHSMPGQGVSSAMKFGVNVGHIEMALTAAEVPFDKVSPQKWMKFYGMKKKDNETKTEWKKRLRERIQQIIPDLKVTNNNADAFLIAYYNWKQHEG